MDNVKIDEAYQKMLDTASIKEEDLSDDGKLTNEQIQKISDKIEDISKDNEVLQAVASLPSNNGVVEAPNVLANREEIVEKEVVATVDPGTGALNVVDEVQDDSEIPEVDLNDYLDMAAYESGTMDLDKVELSESLIKEYDLSDQDCINLINLLKRVQSGEKDIPYYNELPDGIKKFVDVMCMEGGVINKPARNATARTVIDTIFHEIGADMFIVDISNVIDNEVKKSGVNLSEIYEGMIVGKKDKLYEAADKAEAEGKTEASDILRGMGNACEESYMMRGFIDAIDRHAIKLKKFDMEKPRKVVSDFLYKYENSKLCINNVWDLTICIPRHLAASTRTIDPEKITLDTVKAFVLLFCKYCSNMKNTNVNDHIFMYYFIKNILHLDVVPPGEEFAQFAQGMIDRIVDTLELIHERYGY